MNGDFVGSVNNRQSIGGTRLCPHGRLSLQSPLWHLVCILLHRVGQQRLRCVLAHELLGFVGPGRETGVVGAFVQDGGYVLRAGGLATAVQQRVVVGVNDAQAVAHGRLVFDALPVRHVLLGLPG